MVQSKDTDDILDTESEDKEILDSIKQAEKSLNTTMKTPTAYKEHPWSPLKYDVENVHIKTEEKTTASQGLQIIEVEPLVPRIIHRPRLAVNASANATSFVKRTTLAVN